MTTTTEGIDIRLVLSAQPNTCGEISRGGKLKDSYRTIVEAERAAIAWTMRFGRRHVIYRCERVGVEHWHLSANPYWQHSA